MFEITEQQREILGDFLSRRSPISTKVFFDNERITFSTLSIITDGKREEEITIYANGATKIEKSENINSSKNTSTTITKDEFY